MEITQEAKWTHAKLLIVSQKQKVWNFLLAKNFYLQES